MNITFNTLSNAIIGLSCFLIAVQLTRLLIKRWRDDIPFKATTMFMIGLFVSGGVGRFILTVFVHHPELDMLVKLLTALISLVTAVLVTLAVESALKMKTPRQYDDLTREKDKLLEKLKHEIRQLERQHGRQRKILG